VKLFSIVEFVELAYFLYNLSCLFIFINLKKYFVCYFD